MESKRKEALIFIELTKFYTKKKDLDIALKFGVKAHKLFATTESKRCLQTIQDLKQNNGKSKKAEEKANIIKNVKNSQNYYTMLGIDFYASEYEIKQAYKKLALLLHPDKNPSPDSGKLFTAVKNAVDTLCDTEKRELYDLKLYPKKSQRPKRKYKPQPKFYSRRPCDVNDKY